MWGVVAVAGPETCQGGDQDKPATIFTPPSLGHNCELRACHRSFSSSTDDALAAAAFILVYTLLYTYRKEEPEVSNRKEQATTNGGSKAAATTTANPKMDAEPPVATDNTGTLVTWWTNRADVWSCTPRAVRCGQG